MWLHLLVVPDSLVLRNRERGENSRCCCVWQAFSGTIKVRKGQSITFSLRPILEAESSDCTAVSSRSAPFDPLLPPSPATGISYPLPRPLLIAASRLVNLYTYVCTTVNSSFSTRWALSFFFVPCTPTRVQATSIRYVGLSLLSLKENKRTYVPTWRSRLMVSLYPDMYWDFFLILEIDRVMSFYSRRYYIKI